MKVPNEWKHFCNFLMRENAYANYTKHAAKNKLLSEIDVNLIIYNEAYFKLFNIYSTNNGGEYWVIVSKKWRTYREDIDITKPLPCFNKHDNKLRNLIFTCLGLLFLFLIFGLISIDNRNIHDIKLCFVFCILDSILLTFLVIRKMSFH